MMQVRGKLVSIKTVYALDWRLAVYNLAIYQVCTVCYCKNAFQMAE